MLDWIVFTSRLYSNYLKIKLYLTPNTNLGRVLTFLFFTYLITRSPVTIDAQVGNWSRPPSFWLAASILAPTWLMPALVLTHRIFLCLPGGLSHLHFHLLFHSQTEPLPYSKSQFFLFTPTNLFEKANLWID